MNIRTYLAVLAAVLVAGCSTVTPLAAPAETASPVAAVVVAPSSSPSVAVLATHSAKPTPKPAPKPAAKPKVKPKPVVHHAAQKPRWPAGCGVTRICCVQYAQCKIPPVTSSVWKVTKGCTVAWRKALHRTTCPPGWPPIP